MLHPRRRFSTHKLKYILPQGVKTVAWARAIRWAGWGFGEALIPVFIFMFASSFAEAGLIRSVFEIVSLLALPIAGMLVDRIPAKRLILTALLLYPLIGISYFLAGVLGMAVFIVIARSINGFLWAFENIGVTTYYRRTADQGHVGSAFGFIDTLQNCAWIIAALIGLVLAPFVPIHVLLLGVVPTSLLAYFFVLRAPSDVVRKRANDGSSFIRPYTKEITELRTWDRRLWLLGALVILSGFISALMWFFIPIDAYTEGANLPMIVLLTIIGALPSLFGYTLGKAADTHRPYNLIAFGLVGVALVLIGLAIFPQYAFKLIASFILGIILELFFVVQNSLITTLGPSETYGRRGSAFESLITLGDLSAPLVLGISLDILGFGSVALIIAIAAIILAAIYQFAIKR